VKRKLIAATAMAAALSASSMAVLAWEVKIETSPMDDSTNVWLSVEADEPALSAAPGPYHTPALNITCREGVTDMSVWFGGHDMADYQEYPVTYRVGNETAQQTTRFELDTSEEHLGLWGGRYTTEFVKALMGHDRFVIEALASGGEILRVVFDITGLEQAIIPLRESCGW